METDIILIFIVLGITLILFVTEWFPIDKISFLIIVALVVLGLTKPEEAISGFANPATITVLSLMIIAIGLEDNGVIDWLTEGIKKMSVLPLFLLIPAFMFVSAGISAFISTTAVVIIFLKIVTQLQEKYGFSSSKLLMPISFAGILGGSCTLMGTSTNLLVNSVSTKLGAPSLGFFEFTMYGAILLVVGMVYMTIASFWLPKDKSPSIESDYELSEFMFSITIPAESEFVDKRIEETPLFGNPTLHIAKLVRNESITNAPGKFIKLKGLDTLVLVTRVDQLTDMIANGNIKLSQREVEEVANAEGELPETKNKIPEELSYAELLILPGSNFIGRTLDQVRKLSLYGSYPVAIQKRKRAPNALELIIRKRVEDFKIVSGDRVLVEYATTDDRALRNIENVVLLNKEQLPVQVKLIKKITTLSILLAVIALASSGILPILGSSLVGVGALLLTGCISLENIYQRINWQIIFLLAGMIPLGIAMSNTGADMWISEKLLNILMGQEDTLVLGLMFLFTMVLSGFISNNATAIIMTPIAMAVAAGLQLDTKPFTLAVMLAANFSFFTPVGYQTNAIIYGTGIYKFKHFLIIGGGLSILLLVVATLLLGTLL
ncbi:MAG: SLC13 family permease [Nonlabens sp.]|nr:SLC13 family permease [Nonlabens sp.]